MFDRHGIYERFCESYDMDSPVALAKMLGIPHSSVSRWRACITPIPWKWLRRAVNDRELSWDWLLEGKGQKHHSSNVLSKSEDFDWYEINRRFLSLFPNKTQFEIAEELDVSQATVSRWDTVQEPVSWERLGNAVKERGVTWDWLIEGILP